MACDDDHTRPSVWKLCDTCGLMANYSLIPAASPETTCSQCKAETKKLKESYAAITQESKPDDQGQDPDPDLQVD